MRAVIRGREGRARRRRRRGAAAAELAFMLPVFFVLVLAQVESARLGQVNQLLAVAAREGVRTAVIEGKTQADVQAAVNRILAGTGINVGTVSPSPSNWQTVKSGTTISLTLSVPYAQVSWTPGSGFFQQTVLTGKAMMNSERLY